MIAPAASRKSLRAELGKARADVAAAAVVLTSEHEPPRLRDIEGYVDRLFCRARLSKRSCRDDGLAQSLTSPNKAAQGDDGGVCKR
jgi:hypothetical protein